MRETQGAIPKIWSRSLPIVETNGSYNPLNGDENGVIRGEAGVVSPLEAHSSYRGDDWSPERLVFHQNLESFAERVGLIVGLQSNGKISQEQAYAEIRKLWKSLRASKGSLLEGKGDDASG